MIPGPLLFWSVPIAVMFTNNVSVRIMGKTVLDRKWTAADIFRQSFWTTASPTISMLMVAEGVDAMFDRNFPGFLWFATAALMALVGMLRLRAAYGINLRRVKSGTLFNHVMQLAKRVGAKVERVYVVPAGRGRLTNAFASSRSVALTDNFGEYLKGQELDAVIAHELGHVLGRHTRKKVLALACVVVAISLIGLAIGATRPLFRGIFMLSALPAVLLSHYYVSRRFEYACDQKAAEFTSSPESVIRALAAIYQKTNSPIDCGRFLEAFSSHPSLLRRVRAIATASSISEAQLSKLLPRSDLRIKQRAAAR